MDGDGDAVWVMVGGETANNGLALFTWALACASTVDSGGGFSGCCGQGGV